MTTTNAAQKTVSDVDEQPRPDDCVCDEDDLDVACWPCYRDGFEFGEPNPNAGDEDGAEVA